MKKFLTFCILILLCAYSFCACSQNNIKHYTTVDSSDVALLSLFTFDGNSESHFGLFNLGHAFLSLENISENNLSIGKNTLAPRKTISIGTWSIKAHFGVWYNVESNYIKDFDKYNGRVSITCGVSLEDIQKINNFINSHDYWSPLNNCSNFALNLWNTIATKEETLEKPLIYSPAKLARALKAFESFEVNRPIETEDKFHYFDGDTPKYFELEK